MNLLPNLIQSNAIIIGRNILIFGKELNNISKIYMKEQRAKNSQNTPKALWVSALPDKKSTKLCKTNMSLVHRKNETNKTRDCQNRPTNT